MRFGYLCGSDGDPLMKRQRISPNRMFVDENHSSERIEFARLMQALRPGDVVFVESLDQLGSTGREISNQWKIITRGCGADLVVLGWEQKKLTVNDILAKNGMKSSTFFRRLKEYRAMQSENSTI